MRLQLACRVALLVLEALAVGCSTAETTAALEPVPEPLPADGAPQQPLPALGTASCPEPERIAFCLETDPDLAAAISRSEVRASPERDNSVDANLFVVRELDAAQVVELGTGLPPAGHCSFLEQSLPAEDHPRILWARLQQANATAWLATTIAEASLPMRFGDEVAIRASAGPFGSYEATGQELGVRSADGELLLWLGSAARPSEFREIPEFEFTLGPERCLGAGNACVARVIQYELDSWRIGAEALHVGYEGAVAQGPFRVHNGGVARFGARCADVSESWLRVGVWRASAE